MDSHHRVYKGHDAIGQARLSIGPDDIYQAARACQRGFVDYLQDRRVYRKQVIEIEAQYRTWTSFLGVFAAVDTCLDSRLADRPEMKELVLSMLFLLERNLQHGICLPELLFYLHCVIIPRNPVSGLRQNSGKQRHPLILDNEDNHSNSIPHAAMTGIKGSMDRLGRLALMIREPSKPESIEKILDYSRRRNPDGFESIILALIRWRFGCANSDSQNDAYVMPDSLQVQLASSIIYRRNRLIYEFRREVKFHAERDYEDISENTLAGPPQRNTDGTPGPKQVDSHSWPQPEKMLQVLDSSVANPRSSNPALGLLRDLPERMLGPTSEHESGFYSSSVYFNNPFISSERLEPPIVPPGHLGRNCTICYKYQSKEVLENNRKWRQVCILWHLPTVTQT